MSRDPECRNCGAPAEDRFGQPCAFCGVLIPKQQIWIPTSRLIPGLERFGGQICLSHAFDGRSSQRVELEELCLRTMCVMHAVLVTTGPVVLKNLAFGNQLVWERDQPYTSGLFEQVGAVVFRDRPCLAPGQVVHVEAEPIDTGATFYLYLRGPAVGIDVPDIPPRRPGGAGPGYYSRDSHDPIDGLLGGPLMRALCEPILPRIRSKFR